jgi:hypothetical protein
MTKTERDRQYYEAHRAEKAERNRQYHEAHREEIIERKRQYREAHRAEIAEYQRLYREANPEKAREHDRRYHEAHREKQAEYDRRRYEANPETIRESTRRWREATRAAVFDHYGRTCQCCGSNDRPTIDHVNGDGREHRAELFGRQVTGVEFYRWLIASGFPPGFQTMCDPCNNSKGNGANCRLDHAGYGGQS